MPRGKRLLTGVMWGSAGVLALAAVVCIVVANFFFPAADQAVLPKQPTDTTFFHATDTAAIRTWKISFTIGGAAVAGLLLSALLHGLFYPPPEPKNGDAKSP